MLREYVAMHPTWIHLIVSEVLAEVTRQNSESLRTAPKARIQDNQKLAVKKIDAIRAQHPRSNVVLDAHCVIDNGQELVRVPEAAIEELRPTALLCIWDDAVRIHERRRLENDRMRPERSVLQLQDYQNEVIQTCKEYRTRLGLELVCVRAGDGEALQRYLARVIADS